MEATARSYEVKPRDKKTVDTADLTIMLCCGRKTAVEIGTKAKARIQVGRRVLWNVEKIQAYLDSISA